MKNKNIKANIYWGLISIFIIGIVVFDLLIMNALNNNLEIDIMLVLLLNVIIISFATFLIHLGVNMFYTENTLIEYTLDIMNLEEKHKQCVECEKYYPISQLEKIDFKRIGSIKIESGYICSNCK